MTYNKTVITLYVGKEKSYEFEKTIPMSLRLIAEFEKHPEPEDCGGIDYAAIYRSNKSER